MKSLLLALFLIGTTVWHSGVIDSEYNTTSRPNALLYSQYVPASYRAAFVTRVTETAERLEIRPEWLMVVMAFETGRSYRADITNKYSGAVGLIQFIPRTAKSLGTTTRELRRMDILQQMIYVEAYFQPYKGRMHSVYDVYLVVFAPAYLGTPDAQTLYRADSPTALGRRRYRYNKAMDVNKDGRITVLDVKKQIRRLVPTNK